MYSNLKKIIVTYFYHSVIIVYEIIQKNQTLLRILHIINVQLKNEINVYQINYLVRKKLRKSGGREE